MRRRVFVVAGEYSANPRHLPPERRTRAFLGALHDEPPQAELERLFFRYPNRSEDGRTRPEDWAREFGIERPVALNDLFASAGVRALNSLHRLLGGGAGDYQRTRDSITDLYVTAMPGLDPNERTNIGLVPQMLKGMLGLSPSTRAQFLVGTSDSGAWAFAQAVRAARVAERPATILVLAGQIIPSGYASQYQIRSVLGEEDQARGLDMLAVGDLLMDVQRRNLGLTRAQIEDHLARVSQRKLQLSAAYPAGFMAGKPARRAARRTPYFDGSDIAAPCCGAAVTILTSDESLVARLAEAKSPRYRRLPAMEVLGVGEGSSNANFLQREAPLVFATAVREALAATADDAQLPFSSFAESAFAVMHDAFPSIELTFLLSMGLGPERAMDRERECWSNPFGGLLAFGHALGASGLVQVNKALHLFSGDARYLRRDAPFAGEPGQAAFREEGALAATSSVGGPLSHVVGGLFRGGFSRLPERERVHERRSDDPETKLSAEWIARRRQLRLALPRHYEEAAAELGEAHGGGAQLHLLEGLTVVSIRSCLRALTPEVIALLRFDGLDALVRPERLEEIRRALRELVLVLLHEAERLPSLFDVFKLLTDELRELAAGWHRAGAALPAHAALSADKLADAIKECLRVPLAVTFGPGPSGALERTVRFLPLRGAGDALLDAAELAGADALLIHASGATAPLSAAESLPLLPWWDARAQRSAGALSSAQAGAPASALVDGLLAPGARVDRQSALELLRCWFGAGTPPLALELALRDAGAPPLQPFAPLPAFVFLARIARADALTRPGAPHELLGHAALLARAWLGAWEISAAQAGDLLSLICFQRRAQPGNGATTVLAAARFAREVAAGALAAGVVIRAAVSFGDGAPFTDLNGQTSVATPAAQRASALLAGFQSLQAESHAPPETAPWIVFDLPPGAPLQQEALRVWMSGWEMSTPGPAAFAPVLYWKASTGR